MQEYINALNDISFSTIISRLSIDSKPEVVNRVKVFVVKNSKVPPGVINTIIVYAMRLKKGRLPNNTYLQKTLDTWVNEYGIKTTKDAFNLMAGRIRYEQEKKNEQQEFRKEKFKN